MAKEAHIKSILEDYLNLETALTDYSKAKEETLNRYDHLLKEHHSPGHNYNTHSAAPIIEAYDEIKKLDKAENETNHKLDEVGERIKEYIHALKGSPLEVRFIFDELDHRAGMYTFYLENEKLKTIHLPVS